MKNEVRSIMVLKLTEAEFNTIKKFANFIDEYRGQICDHVDAVANIICDFAADTTQSDTVELLTYEDILLKVED